MKEGPTGKKPLDKIKVTGFNGLIALVTCLTLLSLTFFTFNSSKKSLAADAPGVDLVLLTPSLTIPANSTFAVTVEAQCNGLEILGVDVYLNYDPLFITVQSVTPGTTLEFALQNEYDNALGMLAYSAGKLTQPFPSQNFTVATITFNAKSPLASTTTALIFNKDPLRETGVTTGTTSVLRNAISLALNILPATPIPSNIVSPTPTPTPSPSPPPPAPSSPPATPSTTPSISPSTSPSNTPPLTPVPPRINTTSVTGITATSATLNGSLSSPGSAKEITLSFEWGTTASYGQTTPIQVVKDLNVYSFPINNLTPGAAYHFRMKAKGEGEFLSSDGIFTTLVETPALSPTAEPTEQPVLRPEPAESPSLFPGWLSGTWLWVIIAVGGVLIITLVLFLLWRNRY
jgi:hypothetical protein